MTEAAQTTAPAPAPPAQTELTLARAVCEALSAYKTSGAGGDYCKLNRALAEWSAKFGGKK